MSIYPEFEIDAAAWLAIPHFDRYDDWADPAEWARDEAADLWALARAKPRTGEVENLVEVLRYLAGRALADGTPGAEHFLHMPDVRTVPHHVKVWIGHEPGATARDWVLADDPDAVEPPVVDPFASDRLGTGLRALRSRVYVPAPGERAVAGELYAVLRYAWDIDGAGSALVITTGSNDLAALLKMMPDLDTFARGVHLVDDDDAPVEPAPPRDGGRP